MKSKTGLNIKFIFPVALMCVCLLLFMYAKGGLDSFVPEKTYPIPPADPPDDLLLELKNHLKQDNTWGLEKRRANLDGMIRIPAGSAVIGCEGKIADMTDCLPLQTVNLSEYYIDRTVATNEQYWKCLTEGMCLPADHLEEYRGEDVAYVPVIVKFRQAERFCLWQGKRLPTEAEWEKAVRGPDGRTYPWGENPPTPNLANYCDKNCTFNWRDLEADDGYAVVSPVTAFPKGASPYGLLDGTGNVKEWVVAAEELPKEYHIARGGSWYSTKLELRAYYRQRWTKGVRTDDKGVRCVADPPNSPQ